MIKKWPFIWGAGNPCETQTIEIHEHQRYLFPEFEMPILAPDLQKLVDAGYDYSVDPEHLGTQNVVMHGHEFIKVLEERGTDLEEIGRWSE